MERCLPQICLSDSYQFFWLAFPKKDPWDERRKVYLPTNLPFWNQPHSCRYSIYIYILYVCIYIYIIPMGILWQKSHVENWLPNFWHPLSLEGPQISKNLKFHGRGFRWKPWKLPTTNLTSSGGKFRCSGGSRKISGPCPSFQGITDLDIHLESHLPTKKSMAKRHRKLNMCLFQGGIL